MSDTTTTESNSGLTGLPQWARVIFLLGVPSAIALFLVYHLTTFGTTGIAELHRMMDLHAQEANQHASESKRTDAGILRVLQGICLNAATNKEEQRRCLD